MNNFQLRNAENQILTFTFSQPQNTIWMEILFYTKL